MAVRLNLSGGSAGRSSRTLASGTLSIGRGERNDWVLADPDRHLSKTHCTLSIENGQCVLTDLSTNGVSINGARTPTVRDSQVVLTDGDEFRIGDYTIVVEEVSGAAAAQPGFGAEHTDPLSIDPLDDPLGRPRDESFSHPVRYTPQMGRGADPFDRQDEVQHRPVQHDEDIFAGKKPAQEWVGPSQADNADAHRHAMIRGRVTTPPSGPAGNVDLDALLGDLSFLAPTGPGQAPPAAAPGQSFPGEGFPGQGFPGQGFPGQGFPGQGFPGQGVPPPGQPAARGAPAPDPFGSFDDLMAPAPARAPAPQPLAPAPPAPPPPAPPPPPPAPPAAVFRPEPQANPFLEAPVPRGAAAQVFTPPAAAPAAPAPMQAPPPAAAPANARSGLEAFLDGAGVPKAATGDDPEAALRAMGQVFRALVEGLREVLMSRAAIKSELRVEATLLRSTNNNPLKFSFSPEEAVIALLGPGRPGYMQPLVAAREGFDDIKTHEVAVMRGVQTALVGLLKRFDPEALESRMTQGVLTSMLPAARKARLWDNFRELHKTIASEAEDDFQAVFGRAFAKAYTAQAQAGSHAGGQGGADGKDPL